MKKTVLAAVAALALAAAGSASAGTVIYNTGDPATATVALGVNDLGHLNTAPNVTANASATGLAFKMAGRTGAVGFQDATAPGCLCEGWGVSTGATSGYANVAGGTAGLTGGAVTGVTGSTVTTTATLTSLPGLRVTHAYAPAAAAGAGALFQATVTITNSTASAMTDVRYVRAMDWDVPNTEFSELVTIKGTATTTFLEFSNDNGFCSSNPLAGCSAILGGTTNTDFTDSGPADHGAYFRFNFGTLAAGASQTFSIFYGAAGSEAGALAAIGAAGIELYSLGQSSGGGLTGAPATFIFGFSGVGGTPVEPPGGAVPEPTSLALVGLGLLALSASRRRAKAKSA